MAGKIHKYDCYDLRKFGINDVKTVVDIGANIGTVSIMSRILFPFARVIAIEPCKETFELLESYMKPWGIECYNFAIGPGTPMRFLPKRFKGIHRFVSEEEEKWWPKEETYTVESMPFSSVFDYFKLVPDERIIIKVDCEGGERYILKEPEFIDIVKKSLMLVMEIHFGFGGTPEEWEEWLSQFKGTHDVLFGRWERNEGKRIKYLYESSKDFPTRGRPQVQLIRKEV